MLIRLVGHGDPGCRVASFRLSLASEHFLVYHQLSLQDHCAWLHWVMNCHCGVFALHGAALLFHEFATLCGIY